MVKALVNDEWINSGINVAWLVAAAGDGIIEAHAAAWDEMQAQPEWREWMTAYEDEIRGPFNYLAVEERDERRVRRKRNGDLHVHVPIHEYLEGDPSVVSRGVIRGVLAIRAEMAGVPAPPL